MRPHVSSPPPFAARCMRAELCPPKRVRGRPSGVAGEPEAFGLREEESEPVSSWKAPLPSLALAPGRRGSLGDARWVGFLHPGRQVGALLLVCRAVRVLPRSARSCSDLIFACLERRAWGWLQSSRAAAEMQPSPCFPSREAAPLWAGEPASPAWETWLPAILASQDPAVGSCPGQLERDGPVLHSACTHLLPFPKGKKFFFFLFLFLNGIL